MGVCALSEDCQALGDTLAGTIFVFPEPIALFGWVYTQDSFLYI